MRPLLMRVALAAVAATTVGPALAQVPQPADSPPQMPPGPSLAALPPQYQYPAPPAYPAGAWTPAAIQAPTPEDAYRDGTINRWEYERLVGPLPAALQGPSVNGSRGGDGGGGDRGG